MSYGNGERRSALATWTVGALLVVGLGGATLQAMSNMARTGERAGALSQSPSVARDTARASSGTIVLAQAGPNDGGGPGGGQGRQGRGGFGGRMPFATGTVSSVDAANGTITVASQFGGGNQTIGVTQTTQLSAQTVVTADALKVGDQVQIQGVPTGITASTITIGQMPSFLTFGRPGGPGAPGGQGNGNPPPAQPQAMAAASASGKVTSVSPLTISISDDVSLTIKLAPNARVSKIATTTLASIKAGDRVMAMGQMDNNGVFVATGVGVNLTMGFGGFGGFGGGGPGGMGGFGGNGGFGGRGRRGGGGAGPGGPPPGGPGGPGGGEPPASDNI